ncbi:MAG: GIY-YIG nuclease family protein [Thermomicrobiales bacterium]
MRVTIEFEWEELGKVSLSQLGKLVIPQVPVGPGVYRFRIPTESAVEVYVGQTNNLRRRMRNYAGTHRGQTASRIRKVLLDHLAEGRQVQHSIARHARVEIDGEAVDASVDPEHVRLLVENAALALARRVGEKAHNL